MKNTDNNNTSGRVKSSKLAILKVGIAILGVVIPCIGLIPKIIQCMGDNDIDTNDNLYSSTLHTDITRDIPNTEVQSSTIGNTIDHDNNSFIDNTVSWTNYIWHHKFY